MTAAGTTELTRAEVFLAERLRASEALQGLVGANVYRLVAPEELTTEVLVDAGPELLEGTAVVFQFLAGTDTLVVGTGPGSRALTAATFVVKAVGPAHVDLAPVADAIDAALHGAQGEVEGLAVTCHRTSPVNYPEVAAGLLYEHLGGQYHLELA